MQVKRVIQVSAGGFYSLFLCEYGSVFASGDGDSGELGYCELGDDIIGQHREGTPIPINTANMNGERVIQVSAGNSHSLFLI